ncbi:MAG TPA: ABC transporter permease, partial [Vicinamibacteria bacterium]
MDLLTDVRQAARRLARSPGFTLGALSLLALGLAANSAIFSLVHAVLLRPLPYPEADRLVMVWAHSERGDTAAYYPEYLDWKAQAASFADLAVTRGQSINLSGGGEPERLIGSFVSASFFPTLGVQAALGRTFRPEESEISSAAPVAVLSHGLWQRRFGGDPAVLGRTLVLNGNPHTVVGILGPDFAPGRAPFDGWFMSGEVFVPTPYFPNKGGLERGQGEMLVLGRLKPGRDVAGAQTEMTLIASRLEKAYPDTHAGRGVRVIPLHEQVAGPLAAPLWVLQGGVVLVLLVACANVAHLLLARVAGRRRDLAVRAALGAGRGRLVRQLLVEAGLLTLMASAAGLVLAWWALQGLPRLLPANVTPGHVGLDGPVLLFTLALCALTTLVFGLVPALQSSRPEVMSVLRDGGRGGTPRARFRGLLVVSEVSLSLVLLVGAGLLLRSALALQRVDPGFNPDRILTMEFRLPPAKYAKPDEIAAFLREALRRIQETPGVESAALARAVPLSGNGATDSYRRPDQPEPQGSQGPVTQVNIVSPAYFQTLGIPLRRGRSFTAEDRADTPPSMVVNAALAQAAFGKEDPLGQRLWLKSTGKWYTVVGVVGDVKHFQLSDAPIAQAYLTHEQDPRIFACVMARTAGPPAPMADPIRRAIWSVDKDQPVWRVQTLQTLVERSRGPAQALSLLVGLFALVALLLAAGGTYGVVSYLAAQRTHEIGVRVALGARGRDVLHLVLSQSLRWAALGVAVGTLVALAATRALGTLLFGVGASDPATFLTVALLLPL